MVGQRVRGRTFARMRMCTRPVLLLSAAISFLCGLEELSASPIESPPQTRPSHLVTNVGQFSALSAADYLVRCDFRLTGVVTLVDTNRDLLVLQDASGAVALNFPLEGEDWQVGQRLTLDGENCAPYFAGFPDYPYRPSGRNVCSSFEAPSNWGEYNLTRMRGYLHPPVTGEYSFWIASDNSSELWLSENTDPSKARKIAFIPRYHWVSPRDWSLLASQNSGPVFLQAGGTYYIEAFGEQTTVGENLAVAWRGPGLNQSVIESPYLTPWGPAGKGTNGVLREYWTNFSAGDLEGLAGPRVFKSALTVEKVRVIASGPGELPNPERIALNQPLLPKDDYRWIQTEGWVGFTGEEGDEATLELSNGPAVVQVHVRDWSSEMSRKVRNVPVRVEGVCEGVYDQRGTLSPGLIWTPSGSCITCIKALTTNANTPTLDQTFQSAANQAMQGFYGTRGVVTFNDRVFGNDYIFVQEDTAAMLVSLETPELQDQLNVGQWVDLGGALEQGNSSIPVITPLVVKDLGWHTMPLPLAQPLDSSASASREGRWCEVEGVVHSANSNGTLSVIGKDGSAYLWIGQTSSNYLSHCVDAKLRARGVLLLTLLDAPVLLIPSRKFVDVEEPAPRNPLDVPKRTIADIAPERMGSAWFHRVRVVGEVTYRDHQSFFVQDASGGIRVRTSSQPAVEEGQTVEVFAFPEQSGFVRTLTEAVVYPVQAAEHPRTRSLDLKNALTSEQSGSLVRISAMLLACRTNSMGQLLELQEQQHLFVATLAAGRGLLPNMAPGSRLRVTGVCNDETTGAFLANETLPEKQFLPSLNILLRSPQDVAVLSGPPWWSLKRTMTLVGTLSTVIFVTLLWVHLLRRRLERQQAAQLAFSRQVLERLEDERRRIAVNLHDSLGQTLMVIKNHAMLAVQSPAEESGFQHRLNAISSVATQAIEEVRQITHDLRPYQLDRLGLTQAIRTSVNQASNATDHTSILFACRVDDIDGLFDKEAEIHVYRIAQEAITNVVRHSAATEAAVVIKKRATAVSLSIRDNGRGFDPAKPASQLHEHGYGLSGIAERVRILGGALAIDSRPAGGTSLTVEIPLPVRKNDR